MAKFHKADEEFQVNSSYIGVEVDPGKYPTGWEGDFKIRCFNKSDSIFIKGDKYIYKCTGETIKYNGNTFWQFVCIDDLNVVVWFVDNNAQSPDKLAMTVGDDLHYLEIVDGEVVSDNVQDHILNVNLQENIEQGVFINRVEAWTNSYGVGNIEQTNPRYGMTGIYTYRVNGNLIGVFDYTEDVSFSADVTGDPKYDPENPNFVYWSVPDNTLIPATSFKNNVLLSDVFESVLTIKQWNIDSLYPKVGTPFYMNLAMTGPAGVNKVKQIYEEENPVACECKWSVTRERWTLAFTMNGVYVAETHIPRYMFLRFSQDVWITEE